jgi:hypothetical protein
VDVPLTPHALKRMAREACLQPYDKAAQALSEDWNTKLDGKHVQRWLRRLGLRCMAERDAELAAFECGQRPAAPSNAPDLLVVSVDAGKVQTCTVDPHTGSRWRDDKVATVSTYLRGTATQEPRALVTTHVATMERAGNFGKLVRLEAEKRGLNSARETIALGDGGNWIDPLLEQEVPVQQRIVDYYHASEHLYACARALYPQQPSNARRKGEWLCGHLWEGRLDKLLGWLKKQSERLGAPQKSDGPEQPRRVLANNLKYFQQHRQHMNYPDYRQRGWPIGSGTVEAAVKQINKRVKGSEQFWDPQGVEPVLLLRALWLSQDDRWQRYWSSRPAFRAA